MHAVRAKATNPAGGHAACDLLKGVVFPVNDVVKGKSGPLADHGWHASTHMLELIEANFTRSISESLECSSSKNIDDASGYAVGEFQKIRPRRTFRAKSAVLMTRPQPGDTS